ncbi:MAG TPA: PsbP-related protein [Nitrososphaeraceae archaeon]
MKSKFAAIVRATLLLMSAIMMTTTAAAQTAAVLLDQTYTNTQCGITIMYPSDWVKEELNQKFGEGGLAPLTSLANFEPNSPEDYKSTVKAEAWDISKYSDKSIEGIADVDKETILSGEYAGSIEQAERTTVNGHHAYSIVYTQPIPDSEEIWKIMATYIVSGDMQYTILFTTTDNETFDKYISVVDSMVNSIKLDEGKKC